MSDDKTIIKPRPGKPPRLGSKLSTDADERTIIKPRPAGAPVDNDRTVIAPRCKPTRRVPQGSDATVVRGKKGAITSLSVYDMPGLPVLIQHASVLLSVISQVRQLAGNIEAEKLRQHIIHIMDKFMLDVGKHYDKDIAQKASYALCATIDEAVLNSPWGQNSVWSQKPLLSTFHRETYGGEKFYTILDEAVDTQLKDYDLIELLYLCLSLGFLGRLRVDKNGSIKAEKIRANTYQILLRNRNRFKRVLSEKIDPIATEKSKLYSFSPIWILAALLTLAAFGFYNSWLLDLNKQSDEVIGELVTLIPIQQEKSLPEGQVRKEIIFLRALLAQEINQGVLSVNDYHNRSAVVLNSSELFPSGSAEMDSAFNPILDKIAKALETIAGRIIVSGHTDNIDIRTARYPSNWHLSLARASTVGKYMSLSADLKARLLPEGRGASEPIADNSTAQGRAKNRRVAIELFYSDILSTPSS
ncbi:MAG: type VI secretion system protein TssL, long form [Cellvibrionaceae bacterium]|nr:type VI secretion system protein TssL, long form [Cellvibrionaceae bacterium]